MQPPKDVSFDPKKQTHQMLKGSKAIKKFLKNRTKEL